MTDAIKFLKDQPHKIEGLGIPFGGPLAGKDLDGEFFSKDTDLCLEWFGEAGRPILYDHGLNGETKTSVIGRQTGLTITDDGVWITAELDKNSRYRAAVGKLIDAEALAFSSGAMPHLVETDRKTGHIKRWPFVELSATPQAANPFAKLYTVKSTDLIAHLAEVETAVPSGLVAAALKALDATPIDDTNDDALPDGVKFADLVDRLTVDGPAWVKARRDWHAKSGRVLSAATRERLASHPKSLRQLAENLDELLKTTDPEADKRAALAEFERFRAIS